MVIVAANRRRVNMAQLLDGGQGIGSTFGPIFGSVFGYGDANQRSWQLAQIDLGQVMIAQLQGWFARRRAAQGVELRRQMAKFADGLGQVDGGHDFVDVGGNGRVGRHLSIIRHHLPDDVLITIEKRSRRFIQQLGIAFVLFK